MSYYTIIVYTNVTLLYYYSFPIEKHNAIHLPSIHRYDFPGPFEGMESAGTASPQLRLFMAN